MPKSICGSVGKCGANRRGDVYTVQYLLNCVPVSYGGPCEELVLDGWVGPKTLAAIHGFQKANLGFADGRVDPGGKTFNQLMHYDPYPSQELSLPSASAAGKSNGKMGGTPGTANKDPWGYYNPASDNYMKMGKQPPDNYSMKDFMTGGYKQQAASGIKGDAGGYKSASVEGIKYGGAEGIKLDSYPGGKSYSWGKQTAANGLPIKGY